MAFPHPKARKDHYRNEDEPSREGVVWNFFEWTINIAEDRNRKDDVNPAKNRTFYALVHDFVGMRSFLLALRWRDPGCAPRDRSSSPGRPFRCVDCPRRSRWRSRAST